MSDMPKRTLWMIANDRGQYLPHPTGVGRGFTHFEPVNTSAATPPRMFATERAAKIALTWWLAGPADLRAYAWLVGDLGDKTGPAAPDGHVMPERKALGMRVVSVGLSW